MTLTIPIDQETEKRLRERAAQNGRSLTAELCQILREAVEIQEDFTSNHTTVHKSVIQLVNTCGACPEQYEAFIGDERVGYLRLRHGYFRVECPDVGGEKVYEAWPTGDGIFEYDERTEHLDAARKAITEWYNNKKKEVI